MKKVFIIFSAILMNLAIKAGNNDVVLTSTNLPLVIINTGGADIVDGVKITATMKIIFNAAPALNHPGDAGNVYNGKVGIEWRGSYSLTFPQKSYAFETRDDLGNSLNVPILDMPAENDWILTSNWNDKTFMRNTLAFNLFERMGHYQPRTRLCEVIVNNEYMGIYVLTEKIKRDTNRVDIAKLDTDDNMGDSLTGGYIIKIDNSNGSDGWMSKYDAIDRPGSYPYFIYDYPKPENITVQQKNYIQAFIGLLDSTMRTDAFNDPKTGYRTYVDVKSFVDYFIIGELSRNVDAYKKSSFFYKEKDKDGKLGQLHAGPVWDFDWAWKNINECLVNAIDGSGWSYNISSHCLSYPIPPDWIVKMLKDTVFANELNTRYFNLRKTLLSFNYLNHYIDSIHTLVNEAQVRHFAKWQILGINNGTPEVPSEIQPATYDGEIDKFTDWVFTRIFWLDDNMPGRYTGTEIANSHIESTTCRLFPNPAHDFVIIEAARNIQQVEIFNSLGSKVAGERFHNSSAIRLNTQSYLPGFFIVKVTLDNHEMITSKFMIQ